MKCPKLLVGVSLSYLWSLKGIVNGSLRHRFAGVVFWSLFWDLGTLHLSGTPGSDIGHVTPVVTYLCEAHFFSSEARASNTFLTGCGE